MRRRGAPVSGSMPASQGISARRNKSEPRGPVARHFGVRVRCRHGALHGGLDRTFHAPRLTILGERQIAVAAVIDIEPLQREGEQRQRVFRAAGFDIGEQRLRQRRLDRQRVPRLAEPPRRAFDDALIRTARQRRQAEGLLTHALEFRRRLQSLVSVRADRDHHDQGRHRGVHDAPSAA